jgi:hypothetical protein
MPAEYFGKGQVSEKTDAFAMGIVIIELLISGSMNANCPEAFPLKARNLVDCEDAADLSASVKGMAARGGWAEGGAIVAADVLTAVAISCTRRTTTRKTPTQVLSQLEVASQLAKAAGGR